MAINEKTIDEIQNDLITFVENYNTTNGKNVDVRTGTVFKDIVIDSPSIQFNSLSVDLVAASKVFSVNFADEVTTDDLDNLAANYGLTRKSSTPATGIQEFLTTKEPTVDIVINAGTIVATQASDSVPEIQYQVTQTVVLPVITKNNFKIIENSIVKYRITAPITAVVAGANGNVSSLTITQLKQPVGGIETTRNSVSTTGGTDQESNSSLGNRIKLKLTGNNVGTENGIKSLMLEDTNVHGVSVVKPGDPELARNEFGGSVDVYIDGKNVATFEEDRTFFAASPEIVVSRQPAKSVVSIIGLASGAQRTFVQGTDYNFVEDSVTLFTGSTRTNNKVVFDIGGVNPDDGTMVSITYTFNKLITDLQTKIDEEQNNLVTTDILIKEAVQADIALEFSITLLPGFTKSNVVQSIENNLTTFIDSKELGVTFNRSDIVSQVENTAGVDAVDLNSLTIKKNDVVITDQKIPIAKFEFMELITVDIFVS